ncbi:transposase, partial [Lactococcus lactis]
GPNIILDPPQVTPDFRVALARWAITNNASYTQIAAKFGYLGTAQIYQWKKIYRNEGPNGLLSISKGRKPKMKQLEAENLELRIKNEALKLLASMKQRTKNSPK